MKLFAQLTILATSLTLFAFADDAGDADEISSISSTTATIGDGEEEEYNLIDVSTVRLEDMAQMISGTMTNGVIVFSEGTILPLRFFLTGNLITLIGEQADFGSVEVQQTFYARFSKTGIDLSSDLETWTPFFDFITGMASIQLSIDDSTPFILFGAEANRIV